MCTGIERRRHSRIPLNWPVVIQTPQLHLLAETINISVEGALILCSEGIEPDNGLEITLTPQKHNDIPVTCEKMWSSPYFSNGFLYMSIGVRFTEISSSDQDIITSIVEEYSLV